LRNGEEHLIEVQPSYGLNDADIERMLEESIEYAEQDFAERQLIEARTEGGSHPVRDIEGAGESESGELCPSRRRVKVEQSVGGGAAGKP